MTRAPDSASALDRALSAPVPGPISTDVPRPAHRVSKVEQVDGRLAVAIEPAALCDVFGVSDPGVAARLLAHLIGVIQPEPQRLVDPASIEQMLSLIESIGPSDTLEAMTATMLVGAQHAALDSLRRALHPDQTPAGRAMYQSLAFKAMHTFGQLVETLHDGRGKAVVKQEVHVTHQHVTVEAGGQAMVGAIDARGRRG
jgi:hypothetical protein